MTLEELFSAILELPVTTLTDQSGRSVLPAWDSLAHVNLVMAMEEVYQVSFSTAEIPAIRSLGDARRYLRQKGATV